jgi:RimJ/RimL family protein N-acetyltransferase
MVFERTFDEKTIKEIITHPRVWAGSTDDFSPDAQDFEPIIGANVWYVLARDGNELLGLWVLHPQNFICWEIHTCLLPTSWGPRGLQAAKELTDWIWINTPCRRVVTNVPDYNRLALRFAKEAGMEQFGINKKSLQKNGQLHDQIMLGVSKD